ncbi:MAG: DUF6445 family protein [Gammaproteobacteria bacterium]|nr:DUF6445 family protein [Gammaproteobacteria bacterium]MDH5241157.1 DUF6445 family protein [Gammaproteobacteria bacterium]MDH5259864.1 DUF6445 family protein [Gammaproteobacteria bacterium]MDH5583000.1 DUF6445 family protein [Gammaproteobacteria bacterium]
MSTPELRLNRDATIDVRRIDGEQICVVIDDFLDNPHEIVEFAKLSRDRFTVPDKSYPGLNMRLPEAFDVTLASYVKRRMARHFGFLRDRLTLFSMLSMTTFKANELSNLQRVCHSDPLAEPGHATYAGILYLFADESLGGTGFYRWRDRPLMEKATKLEMKDPVEALAFLQQHFPSYNQPPCYITESNEIAERIAVVPARFNRWVFYSGDVPHSAQVKYPERLSTDFATGRLTLNCFVTAVPR